MNVGLPYVEGPAAGAAMETISSSLAEALRAHAGAVVGPVGMDDQSLLALGRLLGEPTAKGNGGQLLYEVTPRPQGERRDLSGSRAEFPLHTDSAMLAKPHRYICLACVETTPGSGGESIVVSAEALRGRLSPASVETLAKPLFPFLLQGEDDAAGVQLVAILGRDGTVRYRQEALLEDSALPDAQREAIAELRQALADPEFGARHRLLSGEVLVVDNHRALHGRTAIAEDQPRLLRRMKIMA